MKMWIANTTKQHHEFVWRPKLRDGNLKQAGGAVLPMYGDLRQMRIPMGGQLCVPGIEDQAAIDDLLKQHPEILPFKGITEQKGVRGLCYRVGEDPIAMDKVMERIHLNDEELKKRSADRLKDTALVIANNMRNLSENEQVGFNELRETDVQVAQKGNKEVNDNTPALNSVVEVTEEGKEPSKRGRRSAS